MAAGDQVGNGNGSLDSGELPYVSEITFAIRVSTNGRTSDFFTTAQLRNRRDSDV